MGTNDTTKTTYDGYWQMVLGPRGADRLVREFALIPGSRGLDEWLGTAEEEAIRVGRLPRKATLEVWESYHGTALQEIESAAGRAAAEREDDARSETE